MGANQSQPNLRPFDPRVPDSRLSTNDSFTRANAILERTHGFEADISRAAHLLQRAVDGGHNRSALVLADLLCRGEAPLERDVVRAVNLYRRLTDGDDVEAMFRLGSILETGIPGVEKDAHAAAQLYERASAAGYGEATFKLATLCRVGDCDAIPPNPARAVALYRKAADQGHAPALKSLGYIHETGWGGVQKDVCSAVELYERGVVAGNAGAMFNLGVLFTNGDDGVPADAVRAVGLFRDASERDHDEAMNKLGTLFKHGAIGVERDVFEAVRLFERAGRAGNAMALHNLASMYIEGFGDLAQDPRRAVELFNEAIRHGCVHSHNSLANVLSTGLGAVQKDVCAAVEHYTKGSDLGDQMAMYNLANMYKVGDDGLAPDVPTAMSLYRRAADLGNMDAATNLAIVLRNGTGGVERDVPRAVQLYERAVAAGHANAMFNYAKLLCYGASEVDADENRAIDLYLKAIEQNHDGALCAYAKILCEGRCGVEKDMHAAITFFERAVSHGNAEAMFDLANVLSDESSGIAQDPDRASALYRSAIERGHEKSRLNLAIHLQSGTPEDVQESVRVLEEAVALGDASAMLLLGNMYWDGAYGVEHSPRRAADLFHQAVQLGNTKAINNLALIKLDGPGGVEQDVNAAIQLFQQAVDEGDSNAMYNLAMLYSVGAAEVEPNFERAVELFEKAIALKHTAAVVSLAKLIFREREGEADVHRAISLLNSAVESGNLTAIFILARLYRDGLHGVRKDVQEAISLYERAIELGDGDAMCLLAGMYSSDKSGVERNVGRAISLYRQAIQCENTDAFSRLAFLYHSDTSGVHQDVHEAIRIYNDGITRGDTMSRVLLGGLYLVGNGPLESDVGRGIQLLEDASHAGSAEGQSMLGCILEHGQYNQRRDVARAIELYNSSWKEHNAVSGVRIAATLLSTENPDREPLRAKCILEAISSRQDDFAIPAMHELAILLERGDDGIETNHRRAAQLHAAVRGRVESNSPLNSNAKMVFRHGVQYQNFVQNALEVGKALPKKCLLLTLGGGGRGKTCTVNSIRRMPFVDSHVITEMADFSSFVAEPGADMHDPSVLDEMDFKDSSLPAVSSLFYMETEPEISGNVSGAQPDNAEHVAIGTDAQSGAAEEDVQKVLENVCHPHSDVFERVRHSMVHSFYPPGFKSGAVQVWDMAGQLEYEMAHSLFIPRASIILFVTNLKRVSDEETRKSEVKHLCYWMQLAHSLIENPDETSVIVVGTHKALCPGSGQPEIDFLRNEISEHLPDEVYNDWVQGSDETLSGAEFIAVENSTSQNDRDGSGLNQLESAIQVLVENCIERRECVPMRWYAFMDKFLRDTRSKFNREEVLALGVDFPGFSDNASERSEDILQCLQMFASMGKIALFELSPDEWYLFTDVEDIVNLVGTTTKPGGTIKKRLNREEHVLLKKGFLSKTTLFKLWGKRSLEENKLLLRLLVEFDLLMEVRTPQIDCDAIGVPALFENGWENLHWGSAQNDRQLIVMTLFQQAIPNGTIGRLMAFLHRSLGAEIPHADMVRQDAALISIGENGRVLVLFEKAERRLVWKFRDRNPVMLARKCLIEVDKLLASRGRRVKAEYSHVVLQDCADPPRGCGEQETVALALTGGWIADECAHQLPSASSRCSKCRVSYTIDRKTGIMEMYKPVEPARTYDVFVSHAGPDKMTLAKPLYSALKNAGWNAFLDKTELQCSTRSAPENMTKAMNESRIGIFILSPEFAARKWPMKELCTFLKRNRDAEAHEKPAILPVFYRLSVSEAPLVYDAPEHSAYMENSEYLARCSTSEKVELKQAMSELRGFTGVEMPSAVEQTSDTSAAFVEEIVQKVNAFMLNS